MGEHTLGADSTLQLAAGAATPVVAGTPIAGTDWIASGGGLGGHHPIYQVLSIIVATFLGTMGLPHVLVRFYTNPDGRAARRTALAVIALLSLFYLFPTLLGVFSRLYVPQLLITGTADAAVLLAPGSAIGGLAGQLMVALVAAGAIAAFLATSSGLLVSVAGALATDVLAGRVRDFRVAAVIGGLIPIPLALAASGGLELSRSVGLAFAVAASTLCPLLVLGIWWRGLTALGAACGLAVGGLLSGGAVTVAVAGGVDDAVLRGWPAVLVGYPAAVSVPLAFATMIVVQPAQPRGRCPADVAQTSRGCTAGESRHGHRARAEGLSARRADRSATSAARRRRSTAHRTGPRPRRAVPDQRWICDPPLNYRPSARAGSHQSGA